jgi:hypothetical protein
MRLYIPGHNRACADQSKLSDGHTAYDDRASPKRSSVFDQRGRNLPLISAFESTIWCNRSWQEIVGKADMRSHKDSIFQGHAFKKRDVVLNLHIGANANMSINIDAFPNVALCTNGGMFTHMNLTPDACARANMGLWRYFRLRMNIECCIGHLSSLFYLELVKCFPTKGNQRSCEKNPQVRRFCHHYGPRLIDINLDTPQQIRIRFEHHRRADLKLVSSFLFVAYLTMFNGREFCLDGF